jgi:hypothetical protein
MKKNISCGLCAAILIGSVCNVQAKSPEKNIESTVVSAGDFKQQFELVTAANYNSQAGSITVSGLSTLFGNLKLEVISATGQSLTGLSGGKVGSFQAVIFSDGKSALDLLPSTTYKIEVTGVSLANGASYGIKGVFAQSITPVPEPEAYSMLLAGLGVIGGIAFRRARKS